MCNQLSYFGKVWKYMAMESSVCICGERLQSMVVLTFSKASLHAVTIKVYGVVMCSDLNWHQAYCA